MSTLADTKAEDRALWLLGGDWDAHGTVSIHLPADLAVDLLVKHGWTFDNQRWWSPTGRYFWEIDEALRVALTTEVA